MKIKTMNTPSFNIPKPDLQKLHKQFCGYWSMECSGECDTCVFDKLDDFKIWINRKPRDSKS
jgi:hypothetical protein